MTGVGADAYLLVWMYERSAQGMGDLAGPEDFPWSGDGVTASDFGPT